MNREKFLIGLVLAVVILMFTGLSIRAFWFGDFLGGFFCGVAAFMVGNGIFWRVKNKDLTP